MGIDTTLRFDAKLDTSLFDKVTRQIFNYWFHGYERPDDKELSEHPFFSCMWERVGNWSSLHYEEHGYELFLRFESHPRNWSENSANDFAQWVSQFVPLENKSRIIIGGWEEDSYDYPGPPSDNLLVYIDFEGKKTGRLVSSCSYYLSSMQAEIKNNQRTEAQKTIIEAIRLTKNLEIETLGFLNAIRKNQHDQIDHLKKMYLELTGEAFD